MDETFDPAQLEYENERLLRAVEQWSQACHQLRLVNEKLTDEVLALRNEVTVLRMAKEEIGE